jgi:hypothetical protein
MARLAVLNPGRAVAISALAVLPVLAIILTFKPGCPIGEPGPVLRFLVARYKK